MTACRQRRGGSGFRAPGLSDLYAFSTACKLLKGIAVSLRQSFFCSSSSSVFWANPHVLLGPLRVPSLRNRVTLRIEVWAQETKLQWGVEGTCGGLLLSAPSHTGFELQVYKNTHGRAVKSAHHLFGAL